MAPEPSAGPPAAKRRILIAVLLILFIAMTCVSLLLFIKYRHETSSNPASQQQQLTRELSQVAEVPSEQPAISTVLNSSKLTNPILAKHAHNGDKLFIYPNSKRLILYRPSDRKVVDMLTIQG